MKFDELKIRRRHLPHWTLKGSAYFITFRAKQAFLSVEEQMLVLKHIINGANRYYYLYAALVMPDHVHLILKPKGDYDLSRIMKGIKGLSARQINLHRKAKGSIWQSESFDRIIRGNKELLEKPNYMLFNACKKGLANNLWEYHGWYLNPDFIVKKE